MKREEGKEVQEAQEAKEKSGDIAALFDLDGTLMPKPSLEKKFFAVLRYRHLVGMRNYFWWLAEAVRLAPRGISQIQHANKMYLRGVRVDEGLCGTDIFAGRLAVNGKAEKEESRERRRRQARMPVSPFFTEAIERVAWHAERGHLIVIVSGTLEPLAKLAARALEAELGMRGMACRVRVCATRIEKTDGRWTGRIVGEAMFGEAKARAVRRIAAEMDLDLERCFAYGDSATDRWMLDLVGRPAAVNPSDDLARIARRNEWTVLCWGKEKNFTQSSHRAQSSRRTEVTREELRVDSVKTGYGT
jgi:alcohol-forming fatty acyl-CoA reductase